MRQRVVDVNYPLFTVNSMSLSRYFRNLVHFNNQTFEILIIVHNYQDILEI